MIILELSENGWDIKIDEPYVPTYRGIITQNVNLLEQPVFEDLNILTTKYKLSVLYDENNPVEIDGFYASAEVIDGSPYFVDVSVAGLDEEIGVDVFASTLLISKLRVGPSGKWLIEIYNGTESDKRVGDNYGDYQVYLSTDGGIANSINIAHLYQQINGPTFSMIIEKGKSWIIHNDYDTNLLWGKTFLGTPLLYANDAYFSGDFATGPVILVDRPASEGFTPRIIDSISQRSSTTSGFSNGTGEPHL